MINLINKLFPNRTSASERSEILEMYNLHAEIVQLGLPAKIHEDRLINVKIDELFIKFDENYRMCRKKIKVSIGEFQKGRNIENANLCQLRFFMGDVIYNDRFIDGLFLRLVNDGVIGRVLERSKDIVGGGGSM